MKGWTLVKSVFALGLIALFAMIYWSSSLLESDLKSIRIEMKQMRSEISRLGQKLRTAQMVSTPTRPAQATKTAFPNLLEADTYLTQTLPTQVGENFQPKGMVKNAIIGRPDTLHPFNGFRDVSNMYQMCTVRVGDLKFGQYETLAPDMATRIETRPRADNPDIQEYWIFLRDDVYWQPLNPAHFPSSLELAPQFLEKHPVTAYDFKFFFDAVNNAYVSESKAASLRTYFNDIEEFRVVDPYTFVIRWTPHVTPEKTQKVKYTSLGLTAALQPLPCFVYQYFADGHKIVEDDTDPDTYRTNSIWAQNFAHHWAKNVIVSCGPYLFDGMNDEGITFKRNPEHYQPYRVLVEGVQYRFKESFDAAWQDFKTGKIDFCTLSPNQLLELKTFLASDEYARQEKEGAGIEMIDYVDLSFYYLGWNTTKPFFSHPLLRKAMTLAIDRNRIIEQNLNDMAISISGPFFRFSPSYDDQVAAWPFDPDEARALLDADGWVDLDGDGIRDKIIDGKRVAFRFKLYYFVKSLSSKVIVDYIATALREIGVDCQLTGLDLADLSRQFDDKNFDAICMGWKLGTPPEDPRQLWHSSGAHEKGSSNAIGFANPEIDQIIDALNYEYDKDKRVSLYHQFHQIIHSESPYTFLYTPKVRLLYREYIHNVFIPRERQDLVPGADIPEPNTEIVWKDKKS
ncbi:MAG: hypothetical protein S4CHLAM2_03820 [Chlamydiales bacterium]|nr:hypothetical protein [Chlamydiales bacterium]